MSYSPEECKRKCEWFTCAAGMGLAGQGRCFLSGAWWMQCCPEYQDEDDFLAEWKQREEADHG